MRIAFIDHSYHQTTRSNAFFRDLVSGIGTVSEFFDETWCGGTNNWRQDFDETDYDLIVLWQVYEAFGTLSGKHRNVVFVPMFDAMLPGGVFRWKSELKHARCVSFCRQLHFEILRRGGTSRYFKYFPDPANYEVISDFTEVRPFFWYRTNRITADLVLELCQNQKIGSFTIHNAPDPGQKALSITNFPGNIQNYKITSWFARREDYAETLRKHNVYFAPREVEGIGMAFLEAMAMGLCVVAPNMPTMSEYIANGTNGLLYALERRYPLDFSRLEEIGARARESIERGFADWQREAETLTEYLVAPKDRPPAAAPARPAPAPAAKISVVAICLNAAAQLEKTIESVLGQDWPGVECLVCDRGSTDGSVEIIGKYASRLAYWHSTPAGNAYQAMNESLTYCTGEWILFMKAGDTFHAADSLSRMLRHVPAGTDVVYGHHLRHTDSAGAYRPAAGFETTWARLQRGEIWFDWLAGIPAHPATAIRRDLLARLRFDTRYSIAADHDLLFRARKGGARFFNCDEIVCVCAEGSAPPTDYALGRSEWAQIARNCGAPAAADRFFQTDMSGEYIARRLAGHYDAAPEEGIDFKRHGMPAFIVDCAGVSYCEDFGRWTDDDVAMFRFAQPLPARFDLVLTGFVLAPNAKRDITVRAGSFKAAFRMTYPPAATVSIPIKNDGRSDTIFIDIPNPAAGSTIPADPRRVGLALVRLQIKPKPMNLWEKWKSWRA